MTRVIRAVLAGSLFAGLLLLASGCGEASLSITACITAEPTIGYAPLMVTFDASCSYVPPQQAGVYTFVWDFDDGASDTGRTVGHTFAEPGTYGVSVGMINESGEPVAGTLRTITVLPAP